jgi:hypothetical protein
VLGESKAAGKRPLLILELRRCSKFMGSISIEQATYILDKTAIPHPMVLLSMTPAIAAAVKIYRKDAEHEQRAEEPSLDTPQPGNPISHAQLVDISRYLKANPEKARASGSDDKDIPIYLNELMRGCIIFTPPPKPKAEPVRIVASSTHLQP